MGGNPETLGALQQQRVNGKDPRKILPFYEERYQKIDAHRIYERTCALDSDYLELSKEEKTELANTMNKIDEDLTRCIKCAMKKCPNTPSQNGNQRSTQFFLFLHHEQHQNQIIGQRSDYHQHPDKP